MKLYIQFIDQFIDQQIIVNYFRICSLTYFKNDSRKTDRQKQKPNNL